MFIDETMIDLLTIRRINKGTGKILWVDVGAGAALGAFEYARENPNVTVFAFEPNIQLTWPIFRLLPNFIVVPMAVAERNGFAKFYISASAPSSSLLPYNEKGVEICKAPNALHETVATVTVPTIRLDTFMGAMGIKKVHFLQVDAQGYDYCVVKSLGKRIKDVDTMQLEVQTMTEPLYSNAQDKTTIVDFLDKSGFTLVEAHSQSGGQEEILVFDRKKGVKVCL